MILPLFSLTIIIVAALIIGMICGILFEDKIRRKNG